MMRFTCIAILTLCLSSFVLPAAPPAPTPAPTAAPRPETATTATPSTPADPEQKKLDPAHMKSLAQAVGAKPGVVNGKVCTITVPREDLDVVNLDMGDIPVEAGLATTLHVFRCGCGKYYVIADFIVTDYESNDVIDGLRSGQFQIASVSPILLQERPRLLSIRCQGEGQIEDVTKTLKETFRWIGENRTRPNPIKE
jgi:hypothetical protein